MKKWKSYVCRYIQVHQMSILYNRLKANSEELLKASLSRYLSFNTIQTLFYGILYHTSLRQSINSIKNSIFNNKPYIAMC